MRVILPFLLAGVLLAACKDVNPGQSQSFFVGQGDVKVKEYRLVDPGDGLGASMGSKVLYVIAKIVWTNDVKPDFAPSMTDFVLLDSNGTRYRAIDSGSVATVGISNPTTPVKKDETQEYTLAFRVPPGTVGTIAYERIFQ